MKRVPIILDKQFSCPYVKPYGYIYLLTNKLNGHRYIGKHVYNNPYIDDNYWGSGGVHLENAKVKTGFYDGVNVFDRIILQWCDTDDNELKELEKYWIDMCGTHRNSEDYNETPGGDGFEDFTPEMKKHWSKLFSGKNNPMYGHVWSYEEKEYRRKCSSNPTKEARIKMSEASLRFLNNGGREIISKANDDYWNHSEIGKRRKEEQSKNWSGKKNPMYGVHLYKEKNGMYGKRLSQEQKDLISKVQSVAVVQLKLKSLEFVSCFSSIKEASEMCNISEYGIGACCRKEQKSSGGYYWMYKEEYQKIKGE